MCSGVIIHRPGQEDVRCDTQGELAQAVGVENIVLFEYPDFEPSYFQPTVCLCPVDLAATAGLTGYVLSDKDPEGEDDPFDDHFYSFERGHE